MNIFKRIFGKKGDTERVKPEAVFHNISPYMLEEKITNWCKDNDNDIDFVNDSANKAYREILCSTILSEHNKMFVNISPDRFWGIQIGGVNYTTTPYKPRAKLLFRMFIENSSIRLLLYGEMIELPRIRVKAESWAENRSQYGKTAIVKDTSSETAVKLRDILYSIGGEQD